MKSHLLAFTFALAALQLAVSTGCRTATGKPALAESVQLSTRVYKIDPKAFLQSLENVTGFNVNSRSNIASGQRLSALAREFFVAAGVNFATNGAGQSPVSFNERKGLLTVRASVVDLEIIDAAIQLLNVTPTPFPPPNQPATDAKLDLSQVPWSPSTPPAVYKVVPLDEIRDNTFVIVVGDQAREIAWDILDDMIGNRR
jgi:hypothetical protein